MDFYNLIFAKNRECRGITYLIGSAAVKKITNNTLPLFTVDGNDIIIRIGNGKGKKM